MTGFGGTSVQKTTEEAAIKVKPVRRSPTEVFHDVESTTLT